MDAKLINPFLSATVNVLQTMCRLEPARGKPFLRKPNEIAHGHVTGIMGIVGKLTGTISVSFEEKAALEAVSNFLGAKLTSIDADVIDGVGELTNIISGAAKKIFTEQGLKFKIAIPTVISGNPHNIHHQRDVPCIVLPFNLPSGKFYVEASIKSS